MDSEVYHKIITDFMYPFILENCENSIKLHQDNDPKHCSRRCVSALNNLGINWVFLNSEVIFVLKNKLNLTR